MYTFNKTDGFSMVLNGKRKHLVLFDYGLFDKICYKINYLISKKGGIKTSINHNFGRIRIDSELILHLLKNMNLSYCHNTFVIIVIIQFNC